MKLSFGLQPPLPEIVLPEKNLWSRSVADDVYNIILYHIFIMSVGNRVIHVRVKSREVCLV